MKRQDGVNQARKIKRPITTRRRKMGPEKKRERSNGVRNKGPHDKRKTANETVEP